MLSIYKGIEKHLPRLICLAGILIILLLLTILVIKLSMFRVIVADGEEIIEVSTLNTTVENLLEDNGIKTIPEDYISKQPDYELRRDTDNNITIKRAVNFTLDYNGNIATFLTSREKVSQVLEDRGIDLGKRDRLIDASLDDAVIEGMYVKILKVDYKIDRLQEDIPFKIIRVANNNMDEGVERVIAEGKNGVIERTYQVVLEDKRETERVYLGERVLTYPEDKIIEYGTVSTYKTTEGEIIRYDRRLDMRATAYTASFKDTGKHPGHPAFGITFTGIKARRGVIAVDPDIIPLGTRVYVEVEGSIPDYGYAIAADTGGAIKGDLIDLYLDNQEDVDRWGCKKVRVYIINDQAKNIF